MAYREVRAVDYREVVRRWLAGYGFRAMARGTQRPPPLTCRLSLQTLTTAFQLYRFRLPWIIDVYDCPM